MATTGFLQKGGSKDGLYDPSAEVGTTRTALVRMCTQWTCGILRTLLAVAGKNFALSS